MLEINPIINIELLSNITFALIILMIGFAIGKLASITTLKILKNTELDKNIKKITKTNMVASKNISSLISILIYITSVILALISLNILKITILIIIYFMAILILGTILIGFFFSLPNLIARTQINKNESIQKNTNIEVENITGTIIKIGLFNTKILGEKKEIFIIPNKIILKKSKKVQEKLNTSQKK